MSWWSESSTMLQMMGMAFLISMVLTPIVRDVFRSYNIVDIPDRRKMHAYPIPRVGGIPLAVAYAFTIAYFSDASGALLDAAWKLIPGGAIMLLVGLLDDFFNLRPVPKLIGQAIAAGAVFWSGVRMESVALMPLPPWLSLILTVLWLLLCSNALNLIDGLDGLCTGIGLFATLTLCGAALLHGNVPLVYATLPLSGALLGFLCFNFSPATVFLGDSGALLIGFLLGGYGMIWTQKTATLLSMSIPLLALSIPFLDVSLSVVRRFLRNQSIFTADRGHIHHRLLDRGLSPRRAVLVLYIGATVAACFALVLSVPMLSKFQNALILGFIVVIWFAIRQLRYSEFHLFRGMLFRGEFQRSLQGRIKLNQLAQSLAQCQSDRQWWSVVEQFAQETGLAEMRWTRADGVDEIHLCPEPPVWRLEIATHGHGTVEIAGYAGFPLDLMKVTLVLQTSLSQAGRWQPSVADSTLTKA